MRYFPAQYGRFPHAGCCETSTARKETAVLDTLSRSGGLPQTILLSGAADPLPAGLAPRPLDGALGADAVGRYQADRALQEFRARVYEGLTGRPDGAFALGAASLCAEHAGPSLVQRSLG